MMLRSPDMRLRDLDKDAFLGLLLADLFMKLLPWSLPLKLEALFMGDFHRRSDKRPPDGL